MNKLKLLVLGVMLFSLIIGGKGDKIIQKVKRPFPEMDESPICLCHTRVPVTDHCSVEAFEIYLSKEPVKLQNGEWYRFRFYGNDIRVDMDSANILNEYTDNDATYYLRAIEDRIEFMDDTIFAGNGYKVLRLFDFANKSYAPEVYGVPLMRFHQMKMVNSYYSTSWNDTIYEYSFESLKDVYARTKTDDLNYRLMKWLSSSSHPQIFRKLLISRKYGFVRFEFHMDGLTYTCETKGHMMGH